MYEKKDLISCLCVTRNRVPLLRRAVACFRAQTHPQRELLIVFESDDAATRDYVATLREEKNICAMEVPVSPKLTLGGLRNLSIEGSNGRYIAQWDDDDWYAPNRLAVQLEILRVSNLPACVLSQWIMYDEVSGAAWLSMTRPWEGSLLADRSVAPVYSDLRRSEDTPAITRMLELGHLAAVHHPWLYIYVYHGRNTWHRMHWRMLVRGAQALGMEQSEKARSLLKGTPTGSSR